MTNPNNAIGTNAAYNGRTSVNAFNDNLAAYTIGILSGWYCEEGTGFSVYLGGDGTYRDVAIASSPNSGDKVTINNISGQPVPVTLPQPPVTDWRIDTIVAYVDNPPQGDETTVDNPGACGIIVVKGQLEAAATDAEIEAAITADGASGATAYWVPLAGVFVPAGAEDMYDCEILDQVYATLNPEYIIPDESIQGYKIADGSIGAAKILNNSITASKIDFSTLSGNYSTSEMDTGFTWIDGKTIYKKTVDCGTLPDSAEKTVPHGISNLDRVIKVEGYAYNNAVTFPLPFSWTNSSSAVGILIRATTINIGAGVDRTAFTETYVTLYYTKTS